MIVFNTKLTTLNEYINAERRNRFIAAKIKKENTEACTLIAKTSGYKLITEKVDIVFHWYKPNNRQDHDNIAFTKKFILDGLVKGGVLSNDNPKHVGNFVDNFFIDKSLSHTACIVRFKKHKTTERTLEDEN